MVFWIEVSACVAMATCQGNVIHSSSPEMAGGPVPAVPRRVVHWGSSGLLSPFNLLPAMAGDYSERLVVLAAL